MTDRLQVNIRLERQLLEELDEMALEESVERAELARRLLRDGLKRERVVRALRRYREGEVSAARAAQEAQVSLYEMLDRIRQEGIPHEVDADELDRIDALFGARRQRTRVSEPARRYAMHRDDTSNGIERLREQFRPARVSWLFVGESSPAGGTHFFRANSNLFRAMREAYARAFGDEVPDGEAFLHYFRKRGDWLVDLADRPVNRLRGKDRVAAVTGGIGRLASTIDSVRPDRLVVIGVSIGAAGREAASAAGFVARTDVLPFPGRQWRAVFVRKLAELLSAGPRSQTS